MVVPLTGGKRKKKRELFLYLSLGKVLRCNGRGRNKEGNGRNTERIPRRTKTPKGAGRPRKAPREAKDPRGTFKET